MDIRPRSAGGGPCPGTEPAALWLITAAVMAGLIMTGLAVVGQAPGPSAAHLAGARQRALSALPGQAMNDAAPHGSTPGGPGAALLGQAALACRDLAFHGVEVQAWWDTDGQGSAVLDVWHAPGMLPLARAVTALPGWPARTVHALEPGVSGPQSLDGDGMLGMSQRLVALLRANYRLAAAGTGSVAGRPSRVVAVYNPAGGLAARFWLDDATKLPLRREMFGGRGQVVSDVAFSELTLGAGSVARLPGAAARRWGGPLRRAQMLWLRGQGWPLPGPLPGHLTLLQAREAASPAGPVVDLDYSDGLSVISVFVQRGHLPEAMIGWIPLTLAGHRVYADDADSHMLTWSAGGFVYTVVAAAPPQTLVRVLAALPHAASPGLLARLGHGLHRLLSWIKP
jgi:sigma-E factor negative regulatory protein RseB